MGSSNSRSSPPAQETQSSRQNLRYTCSMIDDQSINYVLRENANILTREEHAMGREAQRLATQELSRTMRNCELVMHLGHTTITLRAGDCDNRIEMRTGATEWKFTKRSFTQTVYRGVKWLGSRLLSFFGQLSVIAAGAVMKRIMSE